MSLLVKTMQGSPRMTIEEKNKYFVDYARNTCERE